MSSIQHDDEKKAISDAKKAEKKAISDAKKAERKAINNAKKAEEKIRKIAEKMTNKYTKIDNITMLETLITVSYTHLTLPTNREV